MKTTLPRLLALAGIALLASACSRETPPPPASAAPAASKPAASKPAVMPKRYALTGRVVSVVPESKALLVANDDIPGFMPAMTMQYAVDDATLKAATKDARLTAELVLAGDSLRLEHVKFAPVATP